MLQDEIVGREYYMLDFSSDMKIEFTPNDFERYDFDAVDDNSKKYVGEIKCYHKPEHPRPYSKFTKDDKDYGYQIDWSKIFEVWDEARDKEATPLLVAYFSDYLIVWDLNKVGIKELQRRNKLIGTNDKGYRYGYSATKTLQTYLYKDEAIIVRPNEHTL